MVRIFIPATITSVAAIATETSAGNDIASLVSNVGFPIVMCFAFFYYIQKRIDNFSEALNNLTLAITKLLERLDKSNGW